MKTRAIALLATVAISFAYADDRGMKVVGVRTPEGQDISLYENSYALLVGVSDYQTGWPSLPSVPREISDVEAALKANGFSVTKILDPDNTKLERGFREFVRAYGYDPGNRLLFYFAGHGWSRREGEQGYLVPINAPDPNKNERGFLRKALTMTQILAWCKEMEARHALFLFDSCFSGTVFKSRALPETPPHITARTARPVRQFITAGDAGEEVPAKSVFATCFVRGLTGEADLTRDGYITGTELGMYLHDKVIYYRTGQTPQYGKIRDPRLDEGDFVFQVTNIVAAIVSPAQQELLSTDSEKQETGDQKPALPSLGSLLEPAEEPAFWVNKKEVPFTRTNPSTGGIGYTIVTRDGVPAKEAPGTRNKTSFDLEKDTSLVIVDETSQWIGCIVSRGWIRADDVVVQEADSSTSATDQRHYLRTRQSVVVRSMPSPSSQPKYVLDKGVDASLCMQVGDWVALYARGTTLTIL